MAVLWVWCCNRETDFVASENNADEKEVVYDKANQQEYREDFRYSDTICRRFHLQKLAMHPNQGNATASVVVLGTDETISFRRGKKRRKEGVETLMKDLTMDDNEDTEETNEASISMKEELKKHGSMRNNQTVVSESLQDNTLKYCIEVGSSSRVTRSQKKRKKLR
ncbi:hypothetical protein L6452_01395 [Arctium lappa]|uniref:Uncharacterized protein n=1 Tax=Arctium lappa TaxID=4217 RepID=A0ACB9FHL2_ARCLA|nr:hypothetical protein L6452_01395 [Arctium lappa]